MRTRSLAELTVGLPELDTGPKRERSPAAGGPISRPERPPSPATGKPISRDELLVFASWVDPNAPRDQWLKLIAAIRAAPVPDDPGEHFRRDLAHAWSEGRLDKLGRYRAALPVRYTDRKAVDQAFDTMPPKEGGAGVGSLIAAARAAGLPGYVGPTTEEWAQRVGVRLTAPERMHASNAPAVRAQRWRFLDEVAQDALPDLTWLISGILPDGSTAAFHAQMDNYKSFVGTELAMSVAAGLPAFGKFPVLRTGPVVMLLGEGSKGFSKLRRNAWRAARGIDPERRLPVYVAQAVPLVADRADVTACMDAIRECTRAPALIVIDTYSRAMAGLKENDAGDANLYLNMIDAMVAEFGCSVLTVAHEGHEAGHWRGSSASGAGQDVLWRVEANVEAMSAQLINVKMKDEERSKPIQLQGREVRVTDAAKSLVFNWVEPGDYRTTGEPKELVTQDVGAALVKLGAVDGRTIKTRELAFELAGMQAEREGYAPGDTNRVDAIERLLQRESKEVAGRGSKRSTRPGRFCACVAHLGIGRNDPTLWSIPTLSEADADTIAKGRK